MKKALKILMTLTGTMLVLLLLVVFYVIFSLSRFTPVDEAELLAAPDLAPQAQDGWPNLETAIRASSFSNEDDEAILGHLYENKPMTEEAITDLFARNAEALLAIDRAVSVGYATIPWELIVEDDGMANELLNLIKITRLLIIDSRRLSDESMLEAAFAQVRKAISLGTLMQNTHGTLIQLMIGSAIREIAARQLFEMIWDETVPACAAYTTDFVLHEPPRAPEFKAGFFRNEYRWMAENMKAQYDCEGDACPDPGIQEIPPESYFLSFPPLRDGFRQIAADNMLMYKRQADLPVAMIDVRPSEAIWGSPAWLRRVLFGDLFIVGYIDYLKRAAQSDIMLRAARTLMALQCFKATHGKLPQKLTELAPNFLDSVPVDPFDGKPLRYKPNAGYVYSIGWDLVDDGGHVGHGMTHSRDEPTFPLEAPPEKG